MKGEKKKKKKKSRFGLKGEERAVLEIIERKIWLCGSGVVWCGVALGVSCKSYPILSYLIYVLYGMIA